MSVFLSSSWFAAFSAAMVANEPPAPSQPIVIEHRVHDAPAALATSDSHTVTYHVVIDGERSTVMPGRYQRPDIVFAESYATAAAIATGTRGAHDAFMVGDLILQGNVNVLMAARAEWQWLASVAAQIDTTVNPPPH